MKRIKIGVFGFGKTGRLVANEFIKDEQFQVVWVARKSKSEEWKYASRLLGYEFDEGQIISIEDMDEEFFVNHPVDALIDFSDVMGLYSYRPAAKQGTIIISAISNYAPTELQILREYARETAVLYSPNITLGINVLMVAAQALQKIAPHADIEVVEEHFKGKKEVSGTAKKIVNVLGLQPQHLNSIRVGGVVGRHEIIFGMPNQTIRLSHESISRAAFGQGAIFATRHLLDKPPGFYAMEGIVTDMFKQNLPVY